MQATSALERSLTYRGFAEAFRAPDGGSGLLDETLIPPPPANASEAFVAAFDPAVSDSACSLHESAHSSRDQANLFEELVRWYDHFGLRRLDTAELPDHLSVELEFMHFLAWQEHRQSQDEAALSPLRRARAEFADRHLLPFALAVKRSVRTEAVRYRALCAALPEFIESDRRWIGAQSGNQSVTTR